jgi:probable HAF family extracellular repeat protein
MVDENLAEIDKYGGNRNGIKCLHVCQGGGSMDNSRIVRLALCAMAVFGGVETAFADLVYSFTTISYPGALVTRASGINDSGQIVGSFDDAAGITHGFLYSRGSFTEIDDPSASCPFVRPCGTSPSGINSSGEIVGGFEQAQGPYGQSGHGFLFSDGSYTTIDFPGAGEGTTASGINDRGQLVGDFSITPFDAGCFLDAGGSFTRIDFPGAEFTEDCGINNSGEIVGNAGVSSGNIGFLFSGGTFSTLPGFPSGINNKGQIVGYLNGHGFLDSDGSFTRIDVPGSTSTEAFGINDNGQIVGIFENSAGVQGFLATPEVIPEPRTFPVLAASLIGLLAMAYRRRFGRSKQP